MDYDEFKKKLQYPRKASKNIDIIFVSLRYFISYNCFS